MKALRILPVLLLPLGLGGCGVIYRGVLGASGPVADSERWLFYMITIVMLFVIVPVWLMAPIVAWHYRLSNTKSAYRPKWGFNWWIEGLIWVPPTLIVVGLSYFLWVYAVKLDPYKPSVLPPGPALRIQGVSLDWKWLFLYPEQHIAAVNALVIPAGRTVHADLTSGTVMQSLFMPQLAGQIYSMAGMTTKLDFAASRPGAFLGENTQYNGEGFQAERFNVVAVPADQFAQWVQHTHATAKHWTRADYDELFARSTPKPTFYTDVPDDVFQKIHDRFMPAGPESRQPDTHG